jgi:hypothetical protein
MKRASKIVSDTLLKKGFTPLEIPELLNDLIGLVRQDGICTTNYINQELENLGWGIQIIDEALFRELGCLFVDNEHIPKKFSGGKQNEQS